MKLGANQNHGAPNAIQSHGVGNISKMMQILYKTPTITKEEEREKRNKGDFEGQSEPGMQRQWPLLAVLESS